MAALASASQVWLFALHDKRTEQIARALRHNGPVRDVAFSPDGKTVATACPESGVQLWPVPTPLDGDPAQIRLYTEVLTGLELGEYDRARALGEKAWRERRSQCKLPGRE